MLDLDLLIKNGKVYTTTGFQDLDIGVKGEKIALIMMPGTIQKGKQTIDATGKHVLPGIIDVHTHLREPGFTHMEDFESGTRAAAAGGVTMVFPQPNLDPVPNTVENFRMEVELGEKRSLLDFNPCASPLRYEEGWVPKLAAEGTVCFKIFQKVAVYPYSTGAGTINTAHLYEAFKEIAKTGLYCSIHPFDHFFFDEAPKKVKKLGLPLTLKNYHPFVYTDEEFGSAAYQLYFLAKKARMKWYALHLKLPSYLDLVRWAKTEKQMDVIGSCEVMPSIHYASKIFDVERKEWFEVGNKPGTAEDYEKLWQAINDGTIDFLATDHAPQKREAYTLDDPTKSHLGAPMIEWYGHLLLDEVNKGHLSLKRLVEVTSESAAKVFGFYPRKGAILPGSDADLIICDLKREWTITSKRVYTRVQLNPYHGREVKGKITHTILRGAVIMEEGEVKGKPGYGRFIKPSGR